MDVCLLWVLCVLSGRGLCDGLITRPEESYRLWCILVWSRNLKIEEAKTRKWVVKASRIIIIIIIINILPLHIHNKVWFHFSKTQKFMSYRVNTSTALVITSQLHFLRTKWIKLALDIAIIQVCMIQVEIKLLDTTYCMIYTATQTKCFSPILGHHQIWYKNVCHVSITHV
jgi:hypothetical protein